jgi:hypothetical protein
MNVFLFLLITASVLLVYLTYAVRSSRQENAPTSEAVRTLHRFVSLESLDFRHASALFDPTDCYAIASEPHLAETAAEYRGGLRLLALDWLRVQQRDLILLWRFRRLLTSYGAFDGVRSEAAIACRALSILCFLAALRMCVVFAGPFAVRATTSKARELVYAFSVSCAIALGRIPPYQLSAVEASWRKV